MKRVIELLKKSGIVERFQQRFNLAKPPCSITDAEIIDTIKNCLIVSFQFNKALQHDFFDAMMLDVAEAVKNELHIEYVSKTELEKNISNAISELLNNINGRKE